jgi:predicted ATPase
VPGETVYRVPSLPLPATLPPVPAGTAMWSEATQLFVERATAIDPTFSADTISAGTIARICRRLDGIPLAIELAAARVAVLSLEQIEARLHDRFRALIGGVRTAVARQRTLEATIDWSYQLLPTVERSLLSRLSVFPASWTLDAASTVCGGDGINPPDMLDLLSRLVSKSLLTLECDGAGERRYHCLDTVRQFASARLLEAGDADALRDRHLEFVWTEFRGALPILRGPGQVACLTRVGREQEHVRAALDWALDSAVRAEKGVELAGALF